MIEGEKRYEKKATPSRRLAAVETLIKACKQNKAIN